jgi:MFS family permease
MIPAMTSTVSTSPPARGLPGARAALALLLAINLFNYIDRQVLAAVVKPIKTEFFPELEGEHAAERAKYVEFRIGLLATAFMVSYMLMAPVFGLLADRVSRWWLIGIGVILWSLASGGTGLAGTFLMLLLTRAAVGIGEAAYGPAAPTIISDLFPVERRGQVLAWFYMAIPVGSALGYVFGGVVLAWTHDWRWAFYCVVPPGILLGVLCFLMRDPPRGQADAVEHRMARWADYKLILRTPSYVLDTLGMTAMTFAIGGMSYWMPYYVNDYRGQPDLGQVNTIFGGIVVVGGLVATLAGGIAGDRLRRRLPGSYFLVSGWAMLLAFPLLIGILAVPFPWAWGFVFLTVFFLFFNTGPTNTILANVTHPAVRSSAFALNILIIHLFGDAFSPPIIGYLAGQGRAWAAENPQAPEWLLQVLGGRGGMDFGFGVVSVLVLAAGMFWIWGARYLERDTALAPTRVAGGNDPLPR